VQAMQVAFWGACKRKSVRSLWHGRTEWVSAEILLTDFGLPREEAGH